MPETIQDSSLHIKATNAAPCDVCFIVGHERRRTAVPSSCRKFHLIVCSVFLRPTFHESSRPFNLFVCVFVFGEYLPMTNQTIYSAGISGEATVAIIIGQALHVLFACVNLVGNALVVAAVTRRPGLRNHVTLCLANLAVADILLGVSVTVHVYVPYLQPGDTMARRVTCLGILSFATFSALASMVAILLVGFKRWTQVVQHQTFLCLHSLRGTLMLFAGGWAVCGTLAMSVILKNNSGTYTVCSLDFYIQPLHRVTLNMIAAATIMGNAFFCVMLLRHAITARRRVQNISQTATYVGACAREADERKLHNTILMLVTILLAMWLPYLAVTAIPQLKKSLDRYELVRPTLALIQLNSLVNPFIYAWRSRHFRQTLKSLFHKKDISGQGIWRI